MGGLEKSKGGLGVLNFPLLGIISILVFFVFNTVPYLALCLKGVLNYFK